LETAEKARAIQIQARRKKETRSQSQGALPQNALPEQSQWIRTRQSSDALNSPNSDEFGYELHRPHVVSDSFVEGYVVTSRFPILTSEPAAK